MQPDAPHRPPLHKCGALTRGSPVTRRGAIFPSFFKPLPVKQDGTPISDSHVKLCGQQIAIKAPPAPQTQVSLGIYEENEFAAPIPDGVRQFHHKILRYTLQTDKEFESISMDPLLAKEYEDWRAHVRYIEHLYESRLHGGR